MELFIRLTLELDGTPVLVNRKTMTFVTPNPQTSGSIVYLTGISTPLEVSEEFESVRIAVTETYDPESYPGM